VNVYISEESPDSLQTRCLVTPGGIRGNLGVRESATERIPPIFEWVRVKRCGKSVPCMWQHTASANPTGSKAK